MGKRRKREQRQKGMGNREQYDAMEELFRSNAAVPHRNRSRYSRSDWRRKAQAGKYED